MTERTAGNESRDELERRLCRHGDADLLQQVIWYIDFEGLHPQEPIAWDRLRRIAFREKLHGR